MRTAVKLLALAALAGALALALGRWVERVPGRAERDEAEALRRALEEDGDGPPGRPGAASSPGAAPIAPGATPRPRPGDPLHLELNEPPAAAYGRRAPAESERWYATLAARVGGVAYDPALGQAARELASFHLAEGALAPGAVLSFLLDSAGAAEWGVEQVVVTTTDPGEEAVEEQLRRVLSERAGEAPPRRVGIGEAWTLGRPARRHIVFLLSRGELVLDPVPRAVGTRAVATVRGRLPEAAGALSALAMGPDLEVVPLEVARRGDRFQVDVPTGEAPGLLWVELLADGPRGPHPQAQLALHVAEPVATALEASWPPDEAAVVTEADAEDLAWRLVNDDRRRAGLPPLARDPELDAVARGHSRDMRDGGFFGHVSPTTGSLGDRLRRAGVRTVMHAENVARNDTLHDAQDGLMTSLGHRRNILSPQATAVGIGVAADTSRGARQLLLTQVFARARPVVEARGAAREVLAALQASRRAHGLPPLREDGALERAASDEAREAEPSPRGVLDRAGRMLPRGGWASVARLNELSGLEIPADVLDEGHARVGVGVHQRDDGEGPDIVVVLLVGG